MATKNHIHEFSFQSGSESPVKGTKTVAVEGEPIDWPGIPVNNGVTDQLISGALDVSQLADYWFIADVAMTLETNSAATPIHTLALEANVPKRWMTGDTGNTFASPATDVTSFFVTNASGSNGVLKGWAGYSDQTP